MLHIFDALLGMTWNPNIQALKAAAVRKIGWYYYGILKMTMLMSAKTKIFV